MNEKQKELIALLRKLKRESENGEIFWDLETKFTILGVREREIFSKFNEMVEKGRIKMDVNIFWSDKNGKRLNSYYSAVSSRKYEAETPKLNDFKF